MRKLPVVLVVVGFAGPVHNVAASRNAASSMMAKTMAEFVKNRTLAGQWTSSELPLE